MQDIVSQMENYSAEGRDEHWKEKGNKTKPNRKPNPKFMVQSPLLVQIFPVHHYRSLSKCYKMSSSLLGLHFGSCIQEQYFKHGLRNNSTYEFDENNSGFCKLHRNEGGFFPSVIAVTSIFNDCVACCLMDASFQDKCLFQLIEWWCGTSENSWRENNREFFLFYFSETFLLCFPVYVNKLWPRESVKQKISSRLQKRRNMSTRTLSLPCLLASGGRGKWLSYKIQRTGTSETFQLKIVMLPCSVHYKNTFVTHKEEVKLQTKLCCSPLLLRCNLTWSIEPDMLY